jgi:TetR/AcrR family transcriptional regulator, transcriptional repressor of bet genes
VPKIVDITTKRAELVDASLDVIANDGLAGATLRRIAAHMGTSTGSITHYFNGRDALLVEAVRTAHEAAGVRMTRALGILVDPASRLEAVVLEALPLDSHRMREWRVWSAFRGALPGNSLLSGGNEIGYGAWRTLLVTLVTPFFADAEDVRRESGLIMALVDGIGFRLAALPSHSTQLAAEQRQAGDDIRDYLKRVVDLQTRGPVA